MKLLEKIRDWVRLRELRHKLNQEQNACTHRSFIRSASEYLTFWLSNSFFFFFNSKIPYFVVFPHFLLAIFSSPLLAALLIIAQVIFPSPSSNSFFNLLSHSHLIFSLLFFLNIILN